MYPDHTKTHESTTGSLWPVRPPSARSSTQQSRLRKTQKPTSQCSTILVWSFSTLRWSPTPPSFQTQSIHKMRRPGLLLGGVSTNATSRPTSYSTLLPLLDNNPGTSQILKTIFLQILPASVHHSITDIDYNILKNRFGPVKTFGSSSR